MRLLAIVVAALLLSACDDGVDRGACIRSHDWTAIQYVVVNSIPIPIVQTYTTCDEYEFPNGRPIE